MSRAAHSHGFAHTQGPGCRHISQSMPRAAPTGKPTSSRATLKSSKSKKKNHFLKESSFFSSNFPDCTSPSKYLYGLEHIQSPWFFTSTPLCSHITALLFLSRPPASPWLKSRKESPHTALKKGSLPPIEESSLSIFPGPLRKGPQVRLQRPLRLLKQSAPSPADSSLCSSQLSKSSEKYSCSGCQPRFRRLELM